MPEDKRWQRLRYFVLSVFGPACMKCGNVPQNPHVDHIKPKSLYPKLQYSFSNLQVLCRECNQLKSNREAVDYRPKNIVVFSDGRGAFKVKKNKLDQMEHVSAGLRG